MISMIDSGWSGPGSSPDREHCAVFLGKAVYSRSKVPLSTQVYN